jgi:hypothetical protein
MSIEYWVIESILRAHRILKKKKKKNTVHTDYGLTTNSQLSEPWSRQAYTVRWDRWPTGHRFVPFWLWPGGTHQAVGLRPSVPQTAVKDLSLALFSHHLLFLALPSKNQQLLIPSSILLIELIHTSRATRRFRIDALVNRLGLLLRVFASLALLRQRISRSTTWANIRSLSAHMVTLRKRSLQKSTHKRWALVYGLSVFRARFFKTVSTPRTGRSSSSRPLISSIEAGGGAQTTNCRICNIRLGSESPRNQQVPYGKQSLYSTSKLAGS